MKWLVAAIVAALYVLLPVTLWAAPARHVDVLRLRADINPVTADYVGRGISAANSDGATAVIIELDTPGGDLGSMKDIVQDMDASRIPTVVYVYPNGAWAGSAGTFITMASDVAAMAPGTSIGAASPVSSSGGDLGSAEKKKVTNFSISYIAGLAHDHHHNVAFAEAAVRDAKSYTYSQALANQVVNFVAPSLPSLLRQMDGFHVSGPGRPTVTLHTAGASINDLDMDWSENLLLLLADPNLVLILMSVGTLAIIFELSSPGAILPGVVGVLCLSIAFYALGVIPINAAGFVLMGFALLLFIADIKMTTHGILTTGGIISFALGSILLFHPSGGGPTVSLWTVGFVTLLLAGFFGFVVSKAIRARRTPVKSGYEGIINEIGTAQTDLDPDGMVYVEGALWRAKSDGTPILRGSPVRVTGVEGLTLHVSLGPERVADEPGRLASLPLRNMREDASAGARSVSATAAEPRLTAGTDLSSADSVVEGRPRPA